MEHTKGEWFTQAGKIYSDWDPDQDIEIAELIKWWVGDDETDANAHLIAAAPEMYEALEEAVGLFCNEDYHESLGEFMTNSAAWCDRAAAALAAARGES